MRLFVFEGLDFTGKSTLARLLNEHFIRAGGHSRINKGALYCPNYLASDEGEMGVREKDLYFTFLLTQDRLYLGDKEDPGTVIQDRYYPSVMFYGLLNLGDKSLANALPLEAYVQPEMFFYLTCSFNERVRRGGLRPKLSPEDIASLRSEEEHYRRMQIFDSVMGRVDQEYGNVCKISVDSKQPEELLDEITTRIR